MLTRRILIVDEQPLFRQGICSAMQGLPTMRIAGDVEAAHQALQVAVERRPHVALVSQTLPGLTGMTLISSLAGLSFPCAAVAMVPGITPAMAKEAQAAGATGIVSRAVEPGELVAVIERAVSMSSRVKRAESHTGALLHLSTRELEILDCVAQGYSNREIAEALFVTEQTVKNHMTSVFRKLDVEDRVQALLAAVRRGWITFGNGPAYDSEAKRSA